MQELIVLSRVPNDASPRVRFLAKNLIYQLFGVLIHASGWVIQQDDIGPSGERPGHEYFLLVPPAQAQDQRILGSSDLEPLAPDGYQLQLSSSRQPSPPTQTVKTGHGDVLAHAPELEDALNRPVSAHVSNLPVHGNRPPPGAEAPRTSGPKHRIKYLPLALAL